MSTIKKSRTLRMRCILIATGRSAGRTCFLVRQSTPFAGPYEADRTAARDAAAFVRGADIEPW